MTTPMPAPLISPVTVLPAPWTDPLFSREQAELMLGQPGVVLWALPEGAHLMATVIPGAPADVLTLYTVPQQRSCGLATRLLETLIAHARARHCPQVTLEVRAGNTPAVRLYQRHGFTQVGLRRGYYQNPVEDALVYQLNL